MPKKWFTSWPTDDSVWVLFELLKRLGEPYADGLHHLSYGMVDLPTGENEKRKA
ncbi:MAG: hypothetical protein R2788_22710 [Saprospiraceae bacterium]